MTPASPAPSTDDPDALRGAGARLRVRVAGIVQGVGFRPFIHRIAHELGLSGSVCNTFDGAEIEIEGPRARLQAFLDALRDRPPPIARIDRIEVQDMAPTGVSGFRIIESAAGGGQAALISPDVAVCDDCLRELRDPTDRRHRYPFINCTNCGPRFTIVQEVPYDRPKTTMARFAMCERCLTEYQDPADRRYHAQPDACPACGPRAQLISASGEVIAECDEAIERARKMLSSGAIVAVKGLGGFHLACDATNAAAVRALRERKPRRHKPLAVMCRDQEAAQAYCEVTERELRELTLPRRPILLLKRRASPEPGWPAVVEEVAKGHQDLGVMLPYTPVHELLLAPGAPACLVMTSGNRTGGPIEVTNDEAREMLGHIVEAFLVHDRDIWNRCDDSVGAVQGERLVLMRRSRGFVPLPVELPVEVQPTFAVGAMFSNAFAIASGRRVFLSQHIGDVENLEVLQFLEESQDKLHRWLGLKPELIVHDLHPDMLTTRFAAEIAGDARRVAVQHHHAHLASAMAAAGLTEEAQGLVLDGTGYGLDRTIWGGEILVGNAARVRRAGHLRALPLPGGDAATRRPIRIAIAYLHALAAGAESAKLDLWNRAAHDEIAVVRRMVDQRFNTPQTTSAGRLFDAVASLLGVCDEATYEGQAAIELEQFARAGNPGARLRMAVTPGLEVDPQPLLCGLVQGLVDGVSRPQLAYGFHAALAEALAEACARLLAAGAPRKVVLCGGVFQNRILVELATAALQRQGLEPVLPGLIPVSDGGIALGQVMVANAASEQLEQGALAGWEN
ncbi:MAG: carbamoyltransferase HypF [Deltaproteobacteria bacterium]|nr:carbamoyltransferase HypF [Deltaproteobacteria bacterium]